MERLVKIGESEIKMRATAATPMHYRNQFKKDMLVELSAMDGKDVSDMDLGVFERMAYIMSGAFKAGTSLEDWLDQFELMDIIDASAEIMNLWQDNSETRMASHSKNEGTAENSTQV